MMPLLSPSSENNRFTIRRLLLNGAAVVLLTLLTQIGGLIWILTHFTVRLLKRAPGRGAFLMYFAVYYGLATIATWHIAPLFGRQPLACFANENHLALRSPLFCLLNRNYVTPELNRAANALAAHMDERFPGTTTLMLDANFPFFDGFPLLPHLSHDDGRKLDIAYFYQDEKGQFRNGQTRSPIGYFAFQQPGPGQSSACQTSQTWKSLRWNLKPIQVLFPNWTLEESRMREMLLWLAGPGAKYGIEKVFVEPHIARELNVASERIRFQGCQAARHDDHVHFQIF